MAAKGGGRVKAFGFMETYYIADAAAHLLSEFRPSVKPDWGKSREILRSSAVGALRAVWRNGTADEKGTVVARVHVWINRTEVHKEDSQYQHANAHVVAFKEREWKSRMNRAIERVKGGAS